MKRHCVNCNARMTDRVLPVAICDQCVMALGEMVLADMVREGAFDPTCACGHDRGVHIGNRKACMEASCTCDRFDARPLTPEAEAFVERRLKLEITASPSRPMFAKGDDVTIDGASFIVDGVDREGIALVKT